MSLPDVQPRRPLDDPIEDLSASADLEIGSADHHEHVTTLTDTPQIESTAAPRSDGEPESRRGLHLVRRTAGGLAIAGAYVALQAEAAAASAASVMTKAQTHESGISAESKINFLTIVIGIGSAVVSYANRTKESREKRFSDAVTGIGELTSDSTGEQRGARLHAFDSYTDRRKYAPRVFDIATEYLRGRRSGLEELRTKLQTDADDPKFQAAVTARRNGDRNAVDLFFATLPAAHRRLRRDQIKKLLPTGKDDYQTLQELTDSEPGQEPLRVQARGINLDYMRTVKMRDLHEVDLTGAGLQGCQFTNVILKDARLCEAQFEGSTISRSDLSSADLRAAYFYGATFNKCVIDKDTKFGRLPDNHPDAKYGSLDPKQPDEYRGNGEVILKDLVSEALSPAEIIQKVHDWQRNGLKLLGGSNHEYFLDPNDDPNNSIAPAVAQP